MNTNRLKTNPNRSRTAAVAVLGIALSIGITSATASSSPDDHPAAAKGIPNGSVTTAKLHKGAVATSKLQKNAVTGPKIHNKAVGQAKLAPTVVAARAVGTIWYTAGSVTNNRNLTTSNVSRPSEGVYCIFGLPFTPINALATSSFGWNAFEHEVHVWAIGSNQAPCPAGTQVQVRQYDMGTTTPADGNFNIVIF